MIGAEPHGGIDGAHRADALVERVDRLVDHRQQDAVHDESREVFRRRGGLAELLGKLAHRLEGRLVGGDAADQLDELRSEEHTSELQSLMRISYAVFCLKKKKNKK